MADRTVSVKLQAVVTDYMAKMSAASKATAGLAHEVDVAKGKAAQGFHAVGVAGVAMGTVVAGGFALAVKSAADFESKMALVRTLSHSTAAEMSQLSNAALHVGQAYGYSAGEVADAEAELVKAGVSVKDILGGALTGALTLAAAGQTNVAEATQIAATAMTQFALKGKDVPHIADLLAAGADKALGSVGDIGYALDQAGLTAHQFGISIEETVGTLAAFAQAGQTGERGGTVFAQMLAQLSAPSKQASDIMATLGLNVYDTAGQFVGITSLAGQLHDKLGGLTQAERTHDLQVIFGQRAVRGANILYQEGAKGIAGWTKAVNDAGFASLQSAGKLDSLAGDWQKFEVAIGAASIKAGESAQGPLRTLVQDVTKAVEVWNELPGPVRTGAEALVLAAGAVALAGGAAILFIPRWTAMNAALETTGRSAITARGAMLGLGKISGAAVGLAAVYEGAILLRGALEETGPTVEEITSDLIDMGNQGSAAADALINTLIGLSKVHIGLRGNALSDWGDLTKNLDQALSDLVTGGHADLAAKDFVRISDALHKAGMSTDEITKLFPAYSRALANSSNSAKLAGDGVDQFGNKVAGAGKKTKTATDRAKAYGDALHALFDPLFGMNQALQGVTDAQHAVNQAVHKYGADSPQAKQANLDMASAALDAEAAARTLAASVKAGDTSLHDARTQLRAWARDGVITKKSADDVIASFDFLIGRANTISDLHPHMKVTADTSQPNAALTALIDRINAAISGFNILGGVTVSGSSHTTGGGSNPVSYSASHPTGGSGGGGHSGGGHTAPAPVVYVPTGSGDGSGGGGAGKSKSTKERPPTVQEIVHAILTGTIPPSIDKLSKTLQHEIGRLTTVVSNAEQYRSTIRSGLTGYAGLANMGTGTAGTDILGASGPVTAPRVNAYLKDRANKLQQFAHLLNRLDREGLSPDLLSQFAQVGPDAIPAMRQLLSTGHKGIRRADRLERHINRYAGQATQTAVNDRYATALIRSVDRLPDRLQHAVVRGLRGANFHVSLSDIDRHGGQSVRHGR